MTQTSAERAKAAFNHVMDTVLEQGDSSQLKKALTTIGVSKILDLVGMSPACIDSLKAPGTASSDMQVDLNAGEKGLVLMLTGFVDNRHQQGNPIGLDDWFSITPDDFDDYRASPAALAFVRDIDLQNKQRRAITLIQALFRGTAAHIDFGIDLQHKRRAAISIQALYRGVSQRAASKHCDGGPLLPASWHFQDNHHLRAVPVGREDSPGSPPSKFCHIVF